jgi:hypothetical protein
MQKSLPLSIEARQPSVEDLIYVGLGLLLVGNAALVGASFLASRVAP